MAGSCLPTWSRVCGSALQCISCQPKDVISWNLDEPDSSVWDIMPWKASKLPEIGQRKNWKKNKLKTRRLALSHAFRDAHAEGKWRLSWLKAQTVHIRHLLTWESLSKSWWVIGSYLWQSINGIRILQNAQSQVSRRISDEAVGCDSMYSQCIDFSNLPNRDEHVAAHRTFLSWKISKKLEPSVAAPEYTCLIVPILKCGKSSNYCEN